MNDKRRTYCPMSYNQPDEGVTYETCDKNCALWSAYGCAWTRIAESLETLARVAWDKQEKERSIGGD